MTLFFSCVCSCLICYLARLPVLRCDSEHPGLYDLFLCLHTYPPSTFSACIPSTHTYVLVRSAVSRSVLRAAWFTMGHCSIVLLSYIYRMDSEI